MTDIDKKEGLNRIIIENNQAKAVKKDLLKLIEAAAEASLSSEFLDSGCEIYIMLADDKKIREINSKYRNIDTPTDVLSFPVVEMSEGTVISDTGDYDMDEGIMILGDIVISMETVERQAFEYGHSCERELAFLVSHGVYHLLGYDHIEEPMEKRMIAKQMDVLNKLRLT